MQSTLVTCSDLQHVTWLPWSACSFNDELAVFRFALSEGSGLVAHLRGLLSPDEIERAARYRRPSDQLRFSCARGLLRVVLSRYTNQPPDRIEFVAGLNRKPGLKGSAGWHFNVSHSGDWILIVVGKVHVGVDLEWVSPDFSFQDLLPVSFSAAEQHYIDSCSDARLCFYQLWTRKEALVKATAKGMTDTFGQIPSLSGTHSTNAQLIGQEGTWMVNSFPVADAYPAAVAYDGASPVLPRLYILDVALAQGFA
ncbi:4'-phosphopantetheinyl transferase family protein [Spirosoma arcticum]